MIVAVIGAGTMGSGIAQIAAKAGHRVVVVDANTDALRRGSEALGLSLTNAVVRGAMSEDDAASVMSHIGWSSDLADVAGAKLVIEAIVERLEAKAALFAALADRIGSDAILATNTSSLSIAALADAAPVPERFIGLHFFNPAPVMKLVEIVSGPATAAAVRDEVVALMRQWGKRPVEVRDVPGFIVNRVARPYYAEGFAAIEDGIEPNAVDHALTSCGGFRMGPLALADLIGHDVNFAVTESVHLAYGGKTRFRLQPAQRALVQAGKLGRKAGRGIYAGAVLPAPVFAAPGPTPSMIRVSARGGTSVKLFREAGLVCHEDTTLPHGFVDVDGVRLVMTDGRPLSGRDDVDVLADVARDFAVTNTIVLTARDARTAAVMAGLVQATGRSALVIPDRPGMVVLRTLAQLANAASDAVSDGVASVDAIDEAMVYGANHPEGPLHWTERAGPGRVGAALANIAAATGDDIYTPAARLARASRTRRERSS